MWIKVLFIPDYSKGNPYQKALANSLFQEGFNVEFDNTSYPFLMLKLLINYEKPYILHIHWQHPLLLANNLFKTIIKSVSFIFELIILKAFRVKIVWTVHNIKNHENKHLWIEHSFTTLLARLSDAIIAHCERAKHEIRAIYRVKNDNKITVIPNGNYLDFYDNKISRSEAREMLKLSTSDLILLYLGLIRPYKGVQDLIDVFQKLNMKHTKLIIVGKPFNEQIAKQIKNKIKDKRNIKIIPEFIPDNEIQVYMNVADVIVCPYRDILTSSGIVLAMTFRKAIVAPDIGCISEFLDKDGAFLYKTSRKDGLFEALKFALQTDVEKLKRMGEHNFELAKELNWENIAKKTSEVYKECFTEKR